MNDIPRHDLQCYGHTLCEQHRGVSYGLFNVGSHERRQHRNFIGIEQPLYFNGIKPLAALG